jgi:hypothetical protein
MACMLRLLILLGLVAASSTALAGVPGQCWGLAGMAPPATMPDLKAATVVGTGPVFLLQFFDPNCLSTSTGCRSPLDPLKPGDRVAVTEATDGYMCVTPTKHTSNNPFGWLPADRLKLIDPTHATVPLDTWTGTWRDGSTTIQLHRRETGLTVYGDAVWQGRGSPHFGEINDGGTPSGNTLRVGRNNGCEVRLLLFADTLIAVDNMGCGGENASFSGKYRHVSR